VIKLAVVIIEEYHCFQLHTNIFQYPSLKVKSQADKIIGDHQCGFRCNGSTSYQIFCIRQILEKKWENNEAIYHLFIDFKKAYDSIRRELLYSILIEFGVPMKLVILIKMRINKTHSEVHIAKHLSGTFPVQNGLKKEMLYRHCFSALLQNM
jgi:hypothetical protein